MRNPDPSHTFDFASAEPLQGSALHQFVCDQLVKHARFDWVGVYWVEGNDLVLTAWNGPEATDHVRIPVGQGICGLAARTGQTVNVADVNADPRYLSCFPTTRSELVVPVKGPDGNVLGEIDIDSDQQGDFDPPTVALVEEVAQWLGQRQATS